MLTDLGYAKRQILFARAANGRHQTSAVDDALARALDAIERLAEAAPVDEESHTITVKPSVPDCEGDCEHDWQSPYEIVGGVKENPGVWGNGGGVIIHEVCLHCGCERTTNTWAQNPSNGVQGLTSVSYEPGKYADEVRAMAESDE